MNKKYPILLVFMVIAVATLAQNVTFCSKEFEQGVKLHLGIDSTDVVNQTQTDTITSINLSGLGICDIRDVVYLPNVKSLDLSYNNITDIAPLMVLDSLCNLNLSANELNNVDLLTFCNSDSMTVYLAYNYISDFSRLLLPSKCRLNVAGMSAQIDKTAPYLDVYQLYTGFDELGELKIFYRGYANTDNVLTICAENDALAIMDGDMHMCFIPGNPKVSEKLYLTDGTRSDSTWVIPLQRLTVGGGEEISIETGLPDDYSISFANANHGTVTLAGQTVIYQAPAIAVPDTISLSYYQGRKLRGQARYLINSVLLGDVNGEGRVDEVDAQQILDVSAGVKSLGDLTVPEAVGVPGGSSNALEVNAQKVLDYSVAGDKPW